MTAEELRLHLEKAETLRLAVFRGQKEGKRGIVVIGKSNGEIAADLCVVTFTRDFHLDAVFDLSHKIRGITAFIEKVEERKRKATEFRIIIHYGRTYDSIILQIADQDTVILNASGGEVYAYCLHCLLKHRGLQEGVILSMLQIDLMLRYPQFILTDVDLNDKSQIALSD